MKTIHRTAHGAQIVQDGFRDSAGTYGMPVLLTGVWVADRPLDINEGADGDDLVVVEVPPEVFEEYEVAEEGRLYREACIPAAIINQYPRRWATPGEEESLDWSTT